ncbi:hypothetical protein LXA43DRAFT_9309 [Ganoderma leucocontextum]|nr:hypothetical protein LXA43DRAFT_9309 [Ganoderma leucocontextum]
MTRPPTQDLPPPQVAESSQEPPLEWDWPIEHEDRRAEAKADAAVHNATPFQVDRKLLKDIVQERMGSQVARIKFLGAGTFHKDGQVAVLDRCSALRPTVCVYPCWEVAILCRKLPRRWLILGKGDTSSPSLIGAN